MYDSALCLVICGFTSFSTVFQSYQDDGRMNMICSMQAYGFLVLHLL